MNKNPFSINLGATPDDMTRMNAHTPASARLYEEIRDRIVSLDLPPDTTLVRADLAERFNVSKSPVREAIVRLEQDGLVITFPQSRTVVTKIDVARIREEHFLRSAVECEVVRQLAEMAEPATITKARGFVKMQEALADDVEQVVLFKQLDEAFHEALFAGVNQSSLHQYVTARCGNLARVRSLDLPRAGKMVSVLEGHRAVIDAITAHNGEKASKTMREHLSGTMQRLPQIIQENESLFS